MAEIRIPADIPFNSFGKIARVNKAFGCVITEKIDGTNSQIVIESNTIVAVGSRNRWLEPGKETDNFGFAGWVQENYDELLKLGDGSHFGEWYGGSIQRGYGRKEKSFALFNAGRWSNVEERPACCEVVPVLYAGDFSREIVEEVMNDLKKNGSRLVEGFMNPEGIIVYLTATRTYLKDTFEHREGKWKD